MKTKNTILEKIILTVSLVSLLSSCGAKKDIHTQIVEKKKEIATLQAELKKLEAQDTTQKVVAKTKVEIMTTAVDGFASYFEVNGVTTSNQNIQLAPESNGIIKSIKVKEGQQVSAGTLLAVLDTDILQKNVAELKNQLSLAKDLLVKQENLRKQDIGTEVQFLEAKNRKEGLEKSIESLQAQINKAYVKSPISGKIDKIFPNQGEMASPMQPMFRIVSLNEVYVEAQVSETYLGKIKMGDDVDLLFPSLSKEFVKAKISYVGSFINPGNRTLSIHAKPIKSNKNYIPNLLATVKIKDLEAKGVIAVPSKVVQNDGLHDYLFVVNDNNIALRKNVKLGANYKGKVMIMEGLLAGEKVVTKGQTLIVDSTIVTLD